MRSSWKWRGAESYGPCYSSSRHILQDRWLQHHNFCLCSFFVLSLIPHPNPMHKYKHLWNLNMQIMYLSEMQYNLSLSSAQHVYHLTSGCFRAPEHPQIASSLLQPPRQRRLWQPSQCIPFAFSKYPYHVASHKFTALSRDEIAPFLPGITRGNMALFCFWTYCIW